MIQVQNLAKSYGSRLLFEEVTFSVNRGERIGLVGRNGSGKSTLLKVILGEEGYDSGEVQIPKGYLIGSLQQYFDWSEATIVDECLVVLPENEKHERYRAEKILSGLGFSTEDLSRAASEFSGGYQLRINLAKVILSEPHMIFLDEPTNYLDIVSVRWLQGFLKTFAGEAIIITHDRSFMDSVCTHVMGLNRGKVKKVSGRTKDYYEQLLLEDEIYEKTKANQEKKVKEIQQFVDRFKAKASKAKQAQSRLKQLEKMDLLEDRSDESVLNLRFQYKETHAKFLLKVENLCFAYPNQSPMPIKDLSFSMAVNDRIGIVGKNGKGKSTLLNLLANELKPIKGDIQWQNSALCAHFGQTNILRLHLENTIEQEIQISNPELATAQVRAICGAMLFSGDDALKKIKLLSGGERSRVLLGKVMAKPSNVLLLDEPTNHLDMESIDELSAQLNEYPGAVIFVSHSEDFLKQHAKNLIYFTEQKVEYFLGGYQDFLRKVGWEGEAKKEKKPKKEKNKVVKTEVKNNFSQKIESEIEKLEEQLQTVNDQLIEASQQGNAEKIALYSKQLNQLEEQISQQYQKLFEDA